MITAPKTQYTPLLVAALLAVDGLHFVFARALSGHLPPATSAMFVTGIASAIIAVFAARRAQLRWQTFRRHAGFFLTIGALTATSTIGGYTAVSFIDPGTAALLQQMGVLFGVVIGIIWLGERMTRMQIAGAAVCLGGVAIITFQPGDYLRTGALIVIGSSFLYALHAAIAKRYGSGIDFVEFFLWRLTTMTGFLFVASLAQGLLRTPSNQGWFLLALTGTVDVVISRSLYYLTLRRLQVSIFSLVLTLSPVMAILWSLFLFGVQPSARELLGGAAVLAGVTIVTLSRKT